MDDLLLLDTPDRALAPLEAALRRTSVEGALTLFTRLEDLLARIESDHEITAVFVERFVGDGRSGGDGLSVIQKLRAASEGLPIVAVASEGNVEIVAEAVDAGATNFLVLGDQLERRVAAVLSKVRNVAKLRARNRALSQENLAMKELMGAQERIIGRSPQIQALLARVERVARVPRPVLIVGERGTGKELVARLIHERSCEDEGSVMVAAGDAKSSHGTKIKNQVPCPPPGTIRPLITVNCAAFAETMLEGELFGHERGAFTGADRTTPGKFEQAAGGTLFLDEIGAMSLAFQQKILRAVEYGIVTRVGGAREIPVRTRIIAATNADLPKMMLEGTFLRDLYDRLSFETIHMPALRERTGDVELLAQHFLDKFMQEIPAFRGKRLSKSAIQVLNRQKFPGNVRELKNIIERAAYRDTESEITPEDLGLEAEKEMQEQSGGFEDRLESFKNRLINDALVEAKGNQAQAARSLGLTYHQFRYYYRGMNSAQKR